MEKKYEYFTYESWPADRRKRWLEAAHTLGTLMMEHVRDEAFAALPSSRSKASREAVEMTLRALCAWLDGVTGNYGDDVAFEPVLSLRVRDRETEKVLGDFEIAPDGDGLCMIINDWLDNQFDLEKRRLELKSSAKPKPTRQSTPRSRKSTKRSE